MNIGDKVKLTNTKETGIITNILRGDQVEVELDGWNNRQIFSKLELRPISQSVNNQSVETGIVGKSIEKGIYLAFVPQKFPTGDGLILHLINTTDWDLPFTLSIEKSGKTTGIMAGFLKKNSTQRAMKDLLVANFEDWKSMSFSSLYFIENSSETKAATITNKKFQASTFFQNKKKAPILEKEAYLFQLDEKPLLFDLNEIKEKMFETSSISGQISSTKPASEVDLHIENLSKTYWRLSNAEIFELQLKTFEENLEQAIASGLDELVFIHGVGEGKLEAAIHQKLKGHKNVASFGRASQQKYGEGATVVKVK